MGFLDDLFGDTPEGNYETKDTTTFIQSLFGERSFEIEDKGTGEIGRGEGNNARDAKSDAFHHLKDASSYDHKYTAGPEPVNTISSGSSSSGDYSGSYSSYSGGGGSSTNTEIGGLLGMIGAVVIGGAICFGIFGNSKNVDNYPSKPQTINRNLSLEDDIKMLSNYLEQNNQLGGSFKGYKLVIPPGVMIDASKTNIGNKNYEVAFVGPHSLYTFHSSDGGLTWAPFPPTDPFLIKLSQDYVNKIQKNRKWDKIGLKLKKGSH